MNRLEKLLARIEKDEQLILKDLGTSCSPRWLSVLKILDREEARFSITEIARILEKSHPEIHQVSRQLEKAGYISSKTDESDKRRRMIFLSAQGKKFADSLRPVWESAESTLSEWIREIAPDLQHYLNSFEISYEKKSFYQRIKEHMKTSELSGILLTQYDHRKEEHQKVLSDLYENFKSEYFALNHMEAILQNPSREVLTGGGSILFVEVGDQYTGCLILKRRSYVIAEIAFFYVSRQWRGNQYGYKLLLEAIESSRKMGVDTLMVHHNPIFFTALDLLKKNGFIRGDQLKHAFPPYREMKNTLLKNLKVK